MRTDIAPDALHLKRRFVFLVCVVFLCHLHRRSHGNIPRNYTMNKPNFKVAIGKREKKMNQRAKPYCGGAMKVIPFLIASYDRGL